MPQFSDNNNSDQNRVKQLKKVAVKKAKIPNNSVLRVDMEDYVVLDNNTKVSVYLETNGTATCVGVAIRGDAKTLVSHLNDENDNATQNNLKEILDGFLDAVSADRSKIEKILLVSGQDFIDGRNHLSNKVLENLLGREDLKECRLMTGGNSQDVIVDMKSGKMTALGGTLGAEKCINTDANGKVISYPKEVEHGQFLEFANQQANDEVNDVGNSDHAVMRSARNDDAEDNAAKDDAAMDNDAMDNDAMDNDVPMHADANNNNNNEVPDLGNLGIGSDIDAVDNANVDAAAEINKGAEVNNLAEIDNLTENNNGMALESEALPPE